MTRQNLDEISQQQYDRAMRRAERGAEVVGKVKGRGVTHDELSAAFDRVKDRANWKMPINATVQTSTDPEESAREIAMIREAVVYFCGCAAEVHHEGNFRFTVQAVGYYVAVGA